MVETITFRELRTLAEGHGWKVFVEEDGYARFSIDHNFCGKWFYINTTQKNFLKQLTTMLENFHNQNHNLRTFQENYRSFVELVHAVTELVLTKGDVFVW